MGGRKFNDSKPNNFRGHDDRNSKPYRNDFNKYDNQRDQGRGQRNFGNANQRWSNGENFLKDQNFNDGQRQVFNSQRDFDHHANYQNPKQRTYNLARDNQSQKTNSMNSSRFKGDQHASKQSFNHDRVPQDQNSLRKSAVSHEKNFTDEPKKVQSKGITGKPLKSLNQTSSLNDYGISEYVPSSQKGTQSVAKRDDFN